MSFKLDSVKDKKIVERLNSYQFKLSQKIFGRRISLNLSREEAAELTGLSLTQYTRIEQGIDMSSSEEIYSQVLNDLSNLKRNKDIKIKNMVITDSRKSESKLREFPVMHYFDGAVV